MNLTAFNAMKDHLLNVTFESKMENFSSPNVPKLKSWSFRGLDEDHLYLNLNFTNPLYVSSDYKDLLTVHFTNNSYYLRQNDTVQLTGNFTIFEAEVPV